MDQLVASVGRWGLLLLVRLGSCLCSEVGEGVLLAELCSRGGLLAGLFVKIGAG